MKLNTLFHAMKYGLILNVILARLAKIGIKLELFYIVLEGDYNGKPQWSNEFSAYKTSFLGPPDLNEVANTHPWTTLEKLHERLNQGHLCLALKHNNKIAAYTWTDLKECNHKPYPFSLKKHEAYLYDAFTLPEFRGKGLAPFMRYECYQALKSIGRNSFYSISEYTNSPSIKFKTKLNAQFSKLCLCISLGKGARKQFILRDVA